MRAGLLLVLALGCSDSPASPRGITVQTLTHHGARWTVATVDLEHASLRLVGQAKDAPTPHTLGELTAWVERSSGVAPVVAMNAGIYMEDRRPLGLHVEDGTAYRGVNKAEQGYGNFYLMPNGIFSLGPGGAAVTPTAEWGDRPVDQLRLATQSGPLLVHGGELHPRLMPGSPNLKRRNGVGVKSPTTVVLASSEDRVRFHDMATLFRDVLGCADALYLDGTVSAMRTPAQPEAEGDPAGYSGVLVVTPGRSERLPAAPEKTTTEKTTTEKTATEGSGAPALEPPPKTKTAPAP